MNKIFKVIWNHTTQTWVAVSELGKAKTKSKSQTNTTINLSKSLGLISLGTLGVAGTVLGADPITYDGTTATPANTLYVTTSDKHVLVGKTAQGGNDRKINRGEEIVSIGFNTKAAGRQTIAIGSNATAAPAQSSTGPSTFSDWGEAIAIGHNANANAHRGVAIGPDATVEGYPGSVAVGASAKVIGEYGTAVGLSAKTQGHYDIAIGYSASTYNLGADGKPVAHTSSAYNLAVGVDAHAKNGWSIAVGRQARSVNQASAFGFQANASGVQSVAVGTKAKAIGNNSAAFGYQATAQGWGDIALGLEAKATPNKGGGATALGQSARAFGKESGAIGFGNIVGMTPPAALPTDPTELKTLQDSGLGSFAVGARNTITGVGTFVLGYGVTVNTSSSVVLGDSSSQIGSHTVENVTNATVADVSYSGFAGKVRDEGRFVSVGAPDAGGRVNQRKIINMAAGKIEPNSTEAINGSQLYLTHAAINDVNNNIPFDYTKKDDKTPLVLIDGKYYPEAAVANLNYNPVTKQFTDKTTGRAAPAPTAVSEDQVDITAKAAPKNVRNIKGNLPQALNEGDKADNANTTPNATGVAATATNFTKTQTAPQNVGDIYNNAATVGDVLNAGWILQGDTTPVDFVKPYDTVNFIDSDTANITVASTNGKTSTIKVDVITTTLSNSDGEVDTPQGVDGNKLVNASTVVEAINNSGWLVSISRDDDDFEDQDEDSVDGDADLITMGETATFMSGKNIKVKQNGANITYATKDDVEFNSVQLGKGEKGPKLTADANNNIKVSDKDDDKPVNITNLKGNLPQTVNVGDKEEKADGSKKLGDTTAAARTERQEAPTNVADIYNNAATVGDVLNAGWNLGINGDQKDFVKAYDSVNFVNGKGTLADITTNEKGDVSNITFNIDNGEITNKPTGALEGTSPDELQALKDEVTKKTADVEPAKEAVKEKEAELETAKQELEALAAEPEDAPTKVAAKQKVADAETALAEAQKELANKESLKTKAENNLAAVPNKVATVENVVNAVNNSGFNIFQDSTDEANHKALVNPADNVVFKAAGEARVDVTKEKDGTTNITYRVDLPVVYTDKDGNKLVKGEDGNFYAPEDLAGKEYIGDKYYPAGSVVAADGKVYPKGTELNEAGTPVDTTAKEERPSSLLPKTDVIASMNNVDGDTTKPLSLSNVAGTLAPTYNAGNPTVTDGKADANTPVENADVTKQVVNPFSPTSTTPASAADLAKVYNNAATVGDVLNAGWNLQENGTAKDFVKPYDTVNFVDSDTVNVNVTTAESGLISNVSFKVNTGEAKAKADGTVADNLTLDPTIAEKAREAVQNAKQAVTDAEGELPTPTAEAEGAKATLAEKQAALKEAQDKFDAEKAKLAEAEKEFDKAPTPANKAKREIAQIALDQKAAEVKAAEAEVKEAETAATEKQAALDAKLADVEKAKAALAKAENAENQLNNQVATVKNVVDAINGSGFNIFQDDATDANHKALVNPGDKVVYKAAGEARVNVSKEKDGVTNITYRVDLPVVYTDEAGNKLVKGEDGNFYKPDQLADKEYIDGKYYPKGSVLAADGKVYEPGTKLDPKTGNPDPAANATEATASTKDTLKPVENVIASMNNTDGSTTSPMNLANVAGNLPQTLNEGDKKEDGKKLGTKVAGAPDVTTSQTLPDVSEVYNNAATVGDVLNAGWNLKENGNARDFVKPYDTVEFINGAGTTVTVETAKDGKSSTVKVDVNTANISLDSSSNEGKVIAAPKELVEKLAEAEKALADAEKAVAEAEKALAENKDPAKEAELKQAVEDAKAKAEDPKLAEDIAKAKENIAKDPSGNGLVTAKNVADAINSSGWKVTSAANGGTVSGTTEEIINPGETVTLKAGKNIELKQEGNDFTYSLAENIKVNSVTVETADPTDPTKKGSPISMVSVPDAENTLAFVAPKTDANGNVVAAPVTIQNIAGNLQGAKKDGNSFDVAPKNARTEPENAAAIYNNAATVGDVLNAGWNLQNNGEARDFVKPYDAVNFVDGEGTTATVITSPDGKSSDIVYSVNVDGKTTEITYTNADGDTIYKLADGTYNTQRDGKGETVAPEMITGSRVSAILPTTSVGGKQVGGNINFGDSETASVSTNEAGDIVVNVNTGDITANEDEGSVAGPQVAAQKVLDEAKKKLAELPETATPEEKKAAEDAVVAAQKALNNAPNQVATAQNVADAISKSGFSLTAQGQNRSVVNPGETVDMRNTDGNIVISKSADNNDVVYNLARDINVDSVQFGEDGPKVQKGADGSIKVGDKENAPVAITNVAGNLPGAKKDGNSFDVAPKNARTEPENVAAIYNNAATIGDVLNAGWNLQNNGEAKDFVKPYDTVNFVDGQGTTATVTTDADGKVSNITYNVNVDGKTTEITYTNAAGDTIYKLADGTYNTQRNGKGQAVDASTITGNRVSAILPTTTVGGTEVSGNVNFNDSATTEVKAENGNITVNVKTADINATPNGNVEGPAQALINKVKDAEKAVADANQAVADAQKALNENKDLSKAVELQQALDAAKAKAADPALAQAVAKAKEDLAKAPEANKVATAQNVAEAINASGWKATSAADGGTVSGTTEELINPSETVTFKAGKNIELKQNGNSFTYGLADNIEFNSVNVQEVNAGKVTADEVKVGDVVINNAGINAGNKVISNVAQGKKGTDAVNVDQLNGAVNNINKTINRNNKQLRAGIAGANAAAGLPQVYIPGKSMVAASAGTYKGQSAVAVGYSRASDNGKLIFKVQGNANTRGDFGGSVGVGYQW